MPRFSSFSISNYRVLHAYHKMEVPCHWFSIRFSRYARGTEPLNSILPPPPGERAAMQTPTPLPSLSPGNTSCPGSRLLPCWPWTAQHSTLSCMFWKHTRYFQCSPLFFFSISCLFNSVTPLGSSSAAANYYYCCCWMLDPLVCCNKLYIEMHPCSGPGRQVTSSSQPASQPDTRIASVPRKD